MKCVVVRGKNPDIIVGDIYDIDFRHTFKRGDFTYIPLDLKLKISYPPGEDAVGWDIDRFLPCYPDFEEIEL